MPKRKAIGKKDRFEVFKRDNWTCQYCGKKPPDVMLEVDHVVPVAEGGDNRKSNLLAACSDCNQGKGSTSLEDKIPEAFTENELARVQELLERRAAMCRIQEVEREIDELENEDLERCLDKWNSWYFYDDPDHHAPMPRNWRSSFLKFIRDLGANFVCEAIDIAMSKEKIRLWDRWKYFCGICWKELKNVDE